MRVSDESERALTLSEMKFGFSARVLSSHGAWRLALAGTMALAGWVAVPGMWAQVVKAPRYSGGVEAPTQQLNLPPLPPAITPHGEVVEDVVARINDQIISRSDIERAEQQLTNDAQQNKMNSGDMTLAQRDMLRDMIDEQLLLSKAKQLGLNADADVIRQLDDIRKKNNMASLDDLEKAARAQGVSFEDFKAQIRNQILKQEVVRDEVGRRLQLSQADETKYYEAHKADFQQPEQIRLSEILIPLADTASAEQIAQAQAKADDVKAQLTKGSDFADLAKKYSGGPSAAQGGDLGLFKHGALASVLEEETFTLKPGETTKPIRTRQGFVILKVTEHNAAGPMPLKDVEPQIQEAVYMQQMQPALRAYLTKLREESYVQLAPGFVDSGATSNENNTLYTAYAPPPAKKKKVKAKARFDRGNGRYTTVAATSKPVASTPDNGGRSLTGADAKPAVDPNTGLTKPAVDPNTGLAAIAAPKTVAGKNGKPKKIRKEKIRFGQAPRNSIPAGSEDEQVGVDTGKSSTIAAPGAVMSTTGGIAATPQNGTNGADLADNPLAPKAPEKKKTRFAATEAQVKAKKAQTVSLKQEEKVIATPVAATTDEKSTQQVQAAPLGLAGDQLKKKKKPKREKGATKDRLAKKASTPKPTPNVIEPTANPRLAPTDVPDTSKPGSVNAPTGSDNSTTNPGAPSQPITPPNSSVPRPVQDQPDTTLPPATQPPPGSPQQGQPVPGTNPPN